MTWFFVVVAVGTMAYFILEKKVLIQMTVKKKYHSSEVPVFGVESYLSGDEFGECLPEVYAVCLEGGQAGECWLEVGESQFSKLKLNQAVTVCFRQKILTGSLRPMFIRSD